MAEKMETKRPKCKACGKTSEFEKPVDHTYDLRWECPHCQEVNVLQGKDPHPVAMPATVADVSSSQD